MSNIEETLKERGNRYGSFETQGEITQGLKDLARSFDGWSRMAPDQREAFDQIFSKMSRILNGDPDYDDNWHDMGGYSKLIDDRLKSKSEPETPAAPALPLPDLFGEHDGVNGFPITDEGFRKWLEDAGDSFTKGKWTWITDTDAEYPYGAQGFLRELQAEYREEIEGAD